jgi:hypothetical protein
MTPYLSADLFSKIRCNLFTKMMGLIEGGIEVMDGLYWGGDFEQMLTILESDLVSKR